MQLEKLREGLHVSASQLRTYMTCPRKYEYRYVRGVEPEFTTAALVLGTATHAALALFYRGIMERSAVPEFEECKTAFREALAAARKGVVPIEETETDIEAQGAALLRLFYDGARESPPVVLAVEYPFAVELNHPTTGEVLQERLIGGMDLVVQEAGRTTVVEHKTASRKWSQDQVRHDLQITCYRLAAAKLGMGEVGLRVQQLVKTKTPSVVTVEAERGERDINDLLCIIVGILGAVDAQAFFPVRSGKCLTCPFRRRCASE